MSSPDLTETEAALLRTLQAQETADLYDLAQAVGTGPRAVQEAVQSLSQKNLVLVVENGMEVYCTPDGEEVARAEQNRS